VDGVVETNVEKYLINGPSFICVLMTRMYNLEVSVANVWRLGLGLALGNVGKVSDWVRYKVCTLVRHTVAFSSSS